MGADQMCDAINKRIAAEAAARGEVWCGKVQHPSRQPGRVCARCIHRHVLWVAFWRTMGVSDPERDM